MQTAYKSFVIDKKSEYMRQTSAISEHSTAYLSCKN